MTDCLVSGIGDGAVKVGDGGADKVFCRAHLQVGEFEVGGVGMGRVRNFGIGAQQESDAMPTTTTTSARPSRIGSQIGAAALPSPGMAGAGFPWGDCTGDSDGDFSSSRWLQGISGQHRSAKANHVKFKRQRRRAGAPAPHKLRLFAADYQAVDADGWAGHGAAEFQVVCDFGDVEEEFFQISRDRDFFDRIGQFAAGDP